MASSAFESVDGPRWLREATGFALPESVWSAVTVTTVGILACGAFVCVCSGLVARRDVVDARGIPTPTVVPGDTLGRAVHAAEGVVVPPLIAGAWALLLTAGVLVLAPTFDPLATSLVALAFAAAIRTAAYYSERLSETVATMLPFSLLGIVLLDDTALRSLGTVSGAVGRLVDHPQVIVYVLFALLVVEATLRTAAAVTRRLVG